ncbi:thiosulfate oxidation carrier protein SoxY [Ramlibacter sp.]|uniref:thiosulfate oxidation carrier protein SoxY n=1 Tax=Ramlibacter sp. TaxID=1917967 RepID=UPI003D13EB2B
MPTRRQTLRHGLAAGGAIGLASFGATDARAFNKPAFDAKTLQDAMRALGATSFTESKDVSISGPEISENGATVPVSAASTLPGLRQLAVLVEKNPSLLSAVFNLNDAIDASFSLRVKMAESSNVYAVAIGRDGKAYFARREIKVTLGGCAA